MLEDYSFPYPNKTKQKILLESNPIKNGKGRIRKANPSFFLPHAWGR